MTCLYFARDDPRRDEGRCNHRFRSLYVHVCAYSDPDDPFSRVGNLATKFNVKGGTPKVSPQLSMVSRMALV